MHWKDIVPTLESIPKLSRKAALVIGFDGGSALLGHPPAEAFARDLLPARANQAINPTHIKTAWKTLEYWMRSEFLRAHTLGTRPSVETIRYVADMLRERYLTAVVICDPNEQLHRILRDEHGLDIDRFDCGQHRHAVLETYGWGLNDKTRPILVDTSDFFINGIDHGCHGLDGDARVELRKALKNFSNEFDITFFWGWCNRNVIAENFWSGRRRSVYALGDYTACDTFSQPDGYEVVNDESDGQNATTFILDQIGSRLFPDGRRRAARPAAHTAAGLQVTDNSDAELRGSTPPCLLWPDKELEHVRDDGLQSGVVIAGVEGTLVRYRAANRVLGMLRQAGRPCVFRACSDFESIRELLGLLRTGVAAYCAVVFYAPPANMPEAPPSGALRVEIDRWLRETADSRKKLFFFAPLKWIELVQNDGTMAKQFQLRPFAAQNCMTPPSVQRWLETLPLLADFQDGNGASETRALSSMLLDRYNTQRSTRGDWNADVLHQALDIWYGNICATPPGEGDAPVNRPALVEQWDREWDLLLQNLSVRHEHVAEDFTLEVIRRRSKSPDGEPPDDEVPPDEPPPGAPPAGGTLLPDFDLGGVRKKPRR